VTIPGIDRRPPADSRRILAAVPTPAPREPARAAQRLPPADQESRVDRPMVALARSCHPVPTTAVTLLAAGLAVVAGRGAAGTVLVALAVLSGQLSIGWSNDALDARRDEAAGRLDKPAARGAVSARVLWLAAGLALAACMPLSLASGALAGCLHLAGVAAGWAYNLGLKSTVVSWLPFALAFGLLPGFVWLGLPGEPWPPWWVSVGCALLGVGAHLANVLPDREDDLGAGVDGAAHRLDEPTARAVMAALFVAAVATVVLGPPGSPSWWGWAGLAVTGAAAIVVWRRHSARHDRTAFVVAIGVAVLALALLAGTLAAGAG
jgi:4-hydroxybenzoate polyprenyltransferase